MSMTIREVLKWLNTFDPDERIGIDEGGLILVAEDGA